MSDGYMMAPPNGGGGGGDPTPKPRRPSGSTVPAPPTENQELPSVLSAATPVSVVLTPGTILKIVGPLLAIICVAIAFFYKTSAHISDERYHLRDGERGKLETKAEANRQRAAMVKILKREVKVSVDEQQIKNTQQINALRDEQRKAFKGVRKSLRKLRKAIR